ncbi:MAG: hypothetical protein Q8O16_02320 [Dehalococcoidia bacterium]|nr:hypothetical protein [Dehalococcoidia bacterium]
MSGEFILGAKVIINECHSMPDIVGKTGQIVALLLVEEANPYPLIVRLDEPIMISQNLPFGGAVISQPWRGPHYCRPEELTLMGEKTNIPDAFSKAFEDKPKDGKDAGN